MKSRGLRIFVFALIVFLAVGLIGWQAMRPKVRTATFEEVTAVLPKELLETLPEDSAAEERLNRLASSLQQLHAPELDRLADHTLSEEERWGIVQKSLTQKDVQSLAALLNEGPVSVRTGPLSVLIKPEPKAASATGRSMLFSSKGMVLALTQAGLLCARHGQTDRGALCMSVALRLADRFREMHGDIMNYLVMVTVEGIVMNGVQRFAREPLVSDAECAALLGQLKPSVPQDEALAEAIRCDFQMDTLPALPDPYLERFVAARNLTADDEEPSKEVEDDPSTGMIRSCYDALETARGFGVLEQVAIANTRKLYSKRDSTPDGFLNRIYKTLPVAPDSELHDGFGKKWAWFKFRFLANNTPNFYGKVLMSSVGINTAGGDFSFRWRTMRDATRVLLAARLFKDAHGGKLPGSAKDLAPILGAWPTDLYDGKPMRFDAKRHLVYSVGPDLKDDGGDLSAPSFGQPKDVGLALGL